MVWFVDLERVQTEFLQDFGIEIVVGDEEIPAIGSRRIEPSFRLLFQGIVCLEFRPEFREIIRAFKRYSLIAFEDLLSEFRIEC